MPTPQTKKPLLPLSFSTVKVLQYGSQALIDEKNNERGQATNAMKLGSAVEVLMLQPETFNNRFYVEPENINARTKDGAILLQEAKERAEKDGKEFLRRATKDGFNDAVRIADAAKNSPHYKHLLNQIHLQKYVTTEIAGVPFHGYLDAETKHAVIDVKLCTYASPEQIAGYLVERNWREQLAIYWHATGRTKECGIFAVDRGGQCNYVAVPESDLLLGFAQVEKWVNYLLACIENDTWEYISETDDTNNAFFNIITLF